MILRRPGMSPPRVPRSPRCMSRWSARRRRPRQGCRPRGRRARRPRRRPAAAGCRPIASSGMRLIVRLSLGRWRRRGVHGRLRSSRGSDSSRSSSSAIASAASRARATAASAPARSPATRSARAIASWAKAMSQSAIPCSSHSARQRLRARGRLGTTQDGIDARALPLAAGEVDGLPDLAPVVAAGMGGVEHLVVLERRAVRSLEKRPDVIEQVDGQLAPIAEVKVAEGGAVMIGSSWSMAWLSQWICRWVRASRAARRDRCAARSWRRDSGSAAITARISGSPRSSSRSRPMSRASSSWEARV